MRSDAVLLALAGGGPAVNHRNTTQFPKNSKIYEGAEHQVPETPSFGKR
jgi:hypothetical protein